MSQLQRLAAFVGATLAALLVVGVLVSVVFSAGSPAGEIITELKAREQKGLVDELDAGTLQSSALQYERLQVSLEPDGEAATVTATLDFTGELRRPGGAPSTRVSSLGLERLRWRVSGGSWEPLGGLAPRLTAVVRALEARRLALEQPDGGSLGRRYSAKAWFIRSERAEVLVSEDWQLVDERPDRPRSEAGTSRFNLLETDGGFVLVQ